MKYDEKTQLENLSKMMEEMANTPREEMGKRQSGEKCKYEMSLSDADVTEDIPLDRPATGF